ncbi:hypothetical protein ACFV9T_35380, partial [Streptomyces sp. NPDC059850]
MEHYRTRTPRRAAAPSPRTAADDTYPGQGRGQGGRQGAGGAGRGARPVARPSARGGLLGAAA